MVAYLLFQSLVRVKKGSNPQYLYGHPTLLAHRASPLKICCAAATHLANQPALLAQLEESLDHLHVAAVLLDHAQDWMDDLAAGRYNAFVHHLSSRPQLPKNRDIHKQTVMEELWFGEHAKTYFARAHARLGLALVMAEQIHCSSYHKYIVQYHRRLDNYRQVMVDAARVILETATVQIFGEI